MDSRNNYYYGSYGNPSDIRRQQVNPGNRNAAPRDNRPRQDVPKKQKENSSSGFGYFVAALVGIAAGFIAKAFFDEDEKVTRNENRESAPVQGSVNQYVPQQYSEQASDPIDSELEGCNDIVCPITLEVMSDPVISKKCGHSFEGHAIIAWLKSKDYCPKCHTHLQRTDLVKNFSLKNTIDYMRKQAKGKDSK